ncbi:MAG: DNA mismatch repair protein [Flammeovirgaceae bacterium]|nr:DNA mismatch repair protein [Flammeovirgaceae bacterium]
MKKKALAILISRLLVTAAFILPVLLYRAGWVIGAFFIGLGLIGVFLILIKQTDRINWYKILIINKINFNNKQIILSNKLGFDEYNDGSKFSDPYHDYAYDLDFFGPKSLFHLINRTRTFLGLQTLKNDFLESYEPRSIKDRQVAIKELSAQIEWRQSFEAIATEVKDEEGHIESLKAWTLKNKKTIPKVVNVFFLVLGALPVALFISYYFSKSEIYYDLGSTAVLINWLITGLHYRKINEDLIVADHIDQILKKYGLLLAHIDEQDFKSLYLTDLQTLTFYEQRSAHDHVKRLSDIVHQLGSFRNPLAALLLGGLFLYHLNMRTLMLKWKQRFGDHLFIWIKALGQFESLNSFAHFYFNNPEYVFPALNDRFEIEFKNMGHPMVAKNESITNTLTLKDSKFILLTGSNMSGKSTFLRALGINFALAKMGAPVCSDQAQIHPLPMMATMRHADSLSEGKSYFFAEVQKLKAVMAQLDKGRCLLLMDEILRGTNSDDKILGSMRIIKRVMAQKALGLLATHDLQLCDLEQEHPDQMANYCFESEIKNDELVFDYKLRKGVCKSKSATFLLEQNKII